MENRTSVTLQCMKALAIAMLFSCAEISPADDLDHVEEAYMCACTHFDMSCTDDDGIWTFCDSYCIDLSPASHSSFDCIRAVRQLD